MWHICLRKTIITEEHLKNDLYLKHIKHFGTFDIFNKLCCIYKWAFLYADVDKGSGSFTPLSFSALLWLRVNKPPCSNAYSIISYHDMNNNQQLQAWKSIFVLFLCCNYLFDDRGILWWSFNLCFFLQPSTFISINLQSVDRKEFEVSDWERIKVSVNLAY